MGQIEAAQNFISCPITETICPIFLGDVHIVYVSRFSENVVLKKHLKCFEQMFAQKSNLRTLGDFVVFVKLQHTYPVGQFCLHEI